MSENIIFITAVKIDGMEYRSESYKYGIQSFKNWAKDKNCRVVLLEELIHPHDEMKVNFQRYYVHRLLEENNIDYDQILVSDADCIIHPECPNFFEMTDNKFTAVRALGSMDWILRSYEVYSKFLFDNKSFPFYNYFNNKEKIIELQKNYGVGTDQPIINFMANLSLPESEMKFLPYEFCMVDLHRLELIPGSDLLFTKWKGIYQFNCLPSENGQALFGDVHFWMRNTYRYFYGEL